MDRLRYRGRTLDLGLRLLAAFAVTVLSLGLLGPFALWFIIDYLSKNLELDGHHFELRVRPLPFFVACAKLVGLSLLSLGLYAPFAWLRFVRWLSAGIEHRGQPLTFAAEPRGLLLVLAWGLMLSLVSLGLLLPWAGLELARFHLDHLIIGSRRLSLHAPVAAYLLRSWLDLLLTALTLGLYLPWALTRQLHFMIVHTDTVPRTEAPEPGIRAPALAMVSIALAGLCFAAVRYREHLPLETFETAIFERARAAVEPPTPPEGGRAAGAGASTEVHEDPPAKDLVPASALSPPAEATAEPAAAAPAEGACCTAMLPTEPALRAVEESDGTVTLTNRAPNAEP